jgi:Bacterial Ig-like domain (group 1)
LSSAIRAEVRFNGWRKWRVMQRAGLAFLAISAITFGIVNIAGAAGPTQGQIVPNSAMALGTFTPGPFSSGQAIDVVVPANSLFTSNEDINILECAAPDGVPPTDPSACDGNTIQGDSLSPNADGSIDYQAFSQTTYTVYALPDAGSLFEGPSGVTCGDTAATECILYIGTQQSDFTQPHVWSQPFFISANGDDLGESPGDGTAASAPATADASLSSVVATPSTAVADGEDSSLVTVTLLGTSGTASDIPISGRTVTLSQGSGHSNIVPAATPNVTDANGEATFTVTDTTAESVTYTALDTTDAITPSSTTSQPTVVFQAPTVSTTNSKVIADPIMVPTAGDMTTITVTLRDQGVNPQPLANKAVTLAGTGSTVAITSSDTPEMTNAAGVATFTATDSATENVTFTATDTTDSTALTSTATVIFGSLVVSPAQSTITASSPAEAGATTGSKVTVTLLAANGDAVPGKAVTLSTTSATASISGPTPTETGTDGQVSFIVTDSAPENVPLTAEDSTDSVTLPASSVMFEPAAPSASKSVVADPDKTEVADGQTQTQITVTINDQFGNAIAGKQVNLAADTGSSAQSHPIAIGGGSTPGITNSSGQVEFEASDGVAEVVTFTATDASDTLPITQTVSVTFTAGSADPTSRFSTVAAVPPNPPADGTTSSTVTVTIADFAGNPVSGESVALKALNGGSVITTVNATTGADGTAVFTVTDSTAEVVTYEATDVTDANTVLTQQAVVTFGNPPAPPPVAAFCSVVATPASVPGDGSTTSTISVLLYDGNGDAVPGKTVTLAASGGDSTVTTVNGTSDNSGNALFTVTDSTAETVTYTATDTTDNVALTGMPVTVEFTTASGTTSTTTTTSPTTTTTVGDSTTTTSSPTTTTTTTGDSSTTTTAAVSTSPGSTDGGSGGGSGDSSTDGSGSSSLAFTGVSSFLPWLIGIGVLLLGIGTVGRRRFQVAK